MKYIMVAYIKSEKLLESIEGIAQYYGLQAVEENDHYRMLMGYCKQSLSVFVENMYKELDGQDFDIEDTLSIIYSKTIQANSSLGNVVLKRKGNKYLRRKDNWTATNGSSI